MREEAFWMLDGAGQIVRRMVEVVDAMLGVGPESSKHAREHRLNKSTFGTTSS